MGKYMKTKKGSVESSILEVWKNAAEQTEAERLHMQSYEVGTDRYANYTKNLTPGQEMTQKLDERDYHLGWTKIRKKMIRMKKSPLRKKVCHLG